MKKQNLIDWVHAGYPHLTKKGLNNLSVNELLEMWYSKTGSVEE